MMRNLDGKWALITGASSGLGADFARVLAEKRCNLILVARREERLAQLRQELRDKANIDVRIIALDLANPDGAQALFERVRTDGLRVDLLVNNAGCGIYGDFMDASWERHQQLLQLNIASLVQLTRLFVPGMIAAGFGHVLNVASVAAYQPLPTYASYAATKAFVLSFGEALHYELRNTNVRVTTCSPGTTATEFLQIAGQKPTLFQRLTMMQSRRVAEIGIDAMLRGRRSIIPGLLNTLLVFTLRFAPRWWMTRTGHLVMKQPR